jgi:hypothetical protein
MTGREFSITRGGRDETRQRSRMVPWRLLYGESARPRPVEPAVTLGRALAPSHAVLPCTTLPSQSSTALAGLPADRVNLRSWKPAARAGEALFSLSEVERAPSSPQEQIASAEIPSLPPLWRPSAQAVLPVQEVRGVAALNRYPRSRLLTGECPGDVLQQVAWLTARKKAECPAMPRLSVAG